MLKIDLFTAKGIKKGETAFPPSLTEKGNLNILAQAIRVYEDRRHPGLSKTKTRGEVSASTRKIYRQKGTGGARHGAISAPIFVGGGTAHGPTGVKRTLKLLKAIRRKSLKIALTLKAKGKELIVVDGISSFKKTKEVAILLSKIAPTSKKEPPRATFVLSEKNSDAGKFISNLKNSKVELFKNLNAHEVFYGGLIIIDKVALEEGKKSKKDETNKSVKKVVKKSAESKKAVVKRAVKKGKK